MTTGIALARLKTMTETAGRRRAALAVCALLVSLGKSHDVSATASQHIMVDSDADADLNDFGQETYGFDVSWAIHEKNVSSQLGEQRKHYDTFMKGCAEASDEHSCDHSEDSRLLMNRLQPQSMQNYTKTGFAKIKAPDKMFSLLKEFWETNHGKEEIEWPSINTYHNMWSSPPSMIRVQNESLVGGGEALQSEIWRETQKVLEEWTGQMMTPASCWGIRVYPEGSILAPHIDRSPLVTSAIINVDQDVDEPWPLEVYGHDQKPYNVTMEPGDMVLYESHSILHGRPFPLKGRFFANIFIHFEIIGVPKDNEAGEDSLAMQKQVRESIDAGLPPYVLAGSPWEEEWKKTNSEWKLPSSVSSEAAGRGDVATFAAAARSYPSIVETTDENGWTPTHEAARGGHVEMLKLLVDLGANVNERTQFGVGKTPLNIAVQSLGEDHSACDYLRSVGGLDLDYEHEEL